jgi:hypothetical protein
MFSRIAEIIRKEITHEFIISTKTLKGNTQVSERAVISKIRVILDSMNLTYTEAGSQQSKDFRNVNNTGLNIEVKKTDSRVIIFNDTCPYKDIYYVILFTGKEYKKNPEKNIPPQLLFINGEEFIKDCPRLAEFKLTMDKIKDDFSRGTNKKEFSRILSVYPRPTYKADISSFLQKYKV